MKAIDLVRRFARWYTRRHMIIQYMIAIAVIILPIALYAYMTSPRPETFLPPQAQKQEGTTTPLIQGTCRLWLFLEKGKLVLDYANPTIEPICIELNSTHYIYSYPGGYGLAVVLGNSRTYLLFSWPVNLTIGNYTVSVVTAYIAIQNYTDYSIADEIRKLPGYRSLCNFNPENGDWYYSWSRGGIPREFYHLICNEKH